MRPCSRPSTCADALSDLVRRHVSGFRPDPSAVTERLTSLDVESADPLAAIQQALSDPELLLGAVTSPEQRAMRPQLDAIVAVVVGYTDWVVDAVSVRLVGGDALRIAEAVRRQRIETSASDAFVEQLLGIRVGEEQVARGKSFAQGVVDRAGRPRAACRCSNARTRCPRRPRSTPPVSGSPASRGSRDRRIWARIVPNRHLGANHTGVRGGSRPDPPTGRID